MSLSRSSASATKEPPANASAAAITVIVFQIAMVPQPPPRGGAARSLVLRNYVVVESCDRIPEGLNPPPAARFRGTHAADLRIAAPGPLSPLRAPRWRCAGKRNA